MIAIGTRLNSEAPAAESNAILPKKGPAMGDTPSKISSDANT